MSDLHDRDDEMEAQLAELDRIEKLKGPRSPSRAAQYFQPSPPQDMQAEQERLENLKRPRAVPPRVEPDFIQQKREDMQAAARHERIKAATQGRLS
jgi:hypothetical protein